MIDFWRGFGVTYNIVAEPIQWRLPHTDIQETLYEFMHRLLVAVQNNDRRSLNSMLPEVEEWDASMH